MFKNLLFSNKEGYTAWGSLFLFLFFLTGYFPAAAQDSAIPANTGTNTPWVNDAPLSGVTATEISASTGSWSNLTNITNSSTSDYAHLQRGGSGLGGSHSLSGTVSVSDGTDYNTTALTGYYVGVNIDRNITGLAAWSGFSTTLSLYLDGEPTGESYTYTTSITNPFQQDLGFYARKSFDEVQISMSGDIGWTGTYTAQLRIKNVFLRRYTRDLPCNTPSPLVGPGLNATLTSVGVGAWLPLGTAEARIEDSDPATHATYSSVVPLFYSASVKDEAVTYPAGTFGGFTVSSSDLAAVSLLGASRIELRRNGGLVAASEGLSLLSGSVFNTDGSVTIGLVAPAEFDEIYYGKFDLAVSVGTFTLQYPVIKSFCDNPIANLDCNTPTYLHEGDGTNVNFPVHVTLDVGASSLCVNCSIENPDRVIDNDPDNFATVTRTASIVSSQYIGVKSEETDGYPAGTYAGFELEDVNLISLDAVVIHTISTYKNGTEVESYSDGQLVGGKILSSSGRKLVGFKTTKDFDEIRLTIESVASAGVFSTLVYNAVIEKFCPTYDETCNTTVQLARPDFPAFVDARHTGIDGAFAIENSISNTEAMVDSDPDNFATITTLASGLVTVSIGVQDGGNEYPAGTFAGFDVSNPTLLGGGFLNNVEISTLDGEGGIVETVDGSGSLFAIGSSLLTGTGRQTIGFLASESFTGVKITYNKTGSVDIGEIHVYSAVIKSFCEVDDLVCGELTYATNPGYPVYVDGKETGFFGAAALGNTINNSEDAIDDDPDTYAKITLGATVGASASFAVANAIEEYPSSTYAGFDIGSASLFNVGIASSISIQLLNDGVVVQNSTGDALLGGVSSSLLTGGYQRHVMGVVGHVPYDEVKITFENLAAVDLGEIRIYGVVFQPFLDGEGEQVCEETIECESTYVLTNSTSGGKTTSAVVNFERTGTSGAVAAAYGIENPWNAVSPSNTDYATLRNAVSGINTVSLSVATPAVVYPKGTFAGFTIKKNSFIVSADLFPSITISTYLNGQFQESASGGTLLDLALLVQWFGTPTDFYNPGFKTTKPFNEVRVSVGSLVGALQQFVDVYGAYVDTRESNSEDGDGSTPIACSSEFETNPDINVAYLNKPTKGDVSTNDYIGGGQSVTYGTPIPGPNPGSEVPVMNSNGTYTFTALTKGVYTFEIPVCPAGQTTDCPTETLTITVLDPGKTDNPPVVNADLANMTGSDTDPATVTIDVKANDKEGNPGGSLQNPSIQTDPSNGTATVVNDKVEYTPEPGFYGKDVFTYRVFEATSGLFGDAEVVVYVLPPGASGVIASDDYNRTALGSGFSVEPEAGVLVNDSDAAGGTLTVNTTTVTNEAGTLTFSPNGSYTYAPASDFAGTAVFPYTACNSNDICASATLYISVYDQSPLPVKLSDFVVSKEADAAHLSWATTEELNSERFEVERSSEGKNWHRLGTVRASGNSNISRSYTYIDASPAEGINYYRLKIVDRDGTSAYSPVRSASFALASGITITPNPAVENLRVKVRDAGNVEKIELISATGQVLYRSGTDPLADIDVRHLPAGMYILNITRTGGRISTHKVVKN